MSVLSIKQSGGLLPCPLSNATIFGNLYFYLFYCCSTKSRAVLDVYVAAVSVLEIASHM